MSRCMRIMLFVSLLLVSFRSTAGASSRETKAVRLDVDGIETSNITTRKTVGEFLEEKGIELKEKDKINIELDESLNTLVATNIVIKSSFPVYLVIDNEAPIEKMMAHDEKVGHLIQELKKENDVSYFYDGYLNDTFYEGETIYLNTKVIESDLIIEKILFETEIIENDELEIGEKNTIQEGILGEKSIEQIVTYEGEEITEVVELGSEIVKEPVKEIIEIGTKEPRPKTPNGEHTYSNMIVMEATAYSAKQPGLSNYTASGDRAVRGVVAVDPRVIPLGTWVYVEGYGKALASDTGGAIKGNRIDLCFNDVPECYQFGRRNVNVYIIEE